MGYSPQGRKELDVTEVTEHTTRELHCRDFPGPVVKALQRAWVQFLVGELTSHMLLSST